MRQLVFGLGVLLCLAALTSAQDRPLGGGGDMVKVSVVNVEAFVTDKKGEPAPDLSRDDFEIRIDGKPVRVDYFDAPAGAVPAAAPEAPAESAAAPASPGPEPLQLVVYVDNTEIRQANRYRVIRQLEEYLTSRLAPGDRVMIVSHDPGLHVRLPWTEDRAAIQGTLEALKTMPVGGDAEERDRRFAFEHMMSIQVAALSEIPPRPCPPEIAGPAHSFAQSRRREVVETLGALTAIVNSLAGMPGPKALLHVSDGLPILPGAELFEFLYQICGGGAATSGLSQLRPKQEAFGQENSRLEGFERESDPEAAAYEVYDSLTLGPNAYQAASQAHVDAQSYNLLKQVDSLAGHANSRRVTFYLLQASGLEAPGASRLTSGPADRMTRFPSIETTERKSRQDTLSALASATGGKAILNANDALPDLDGMRRDFATAYSLGFSFEERADGSEHRIDVRVKRPGLRVRHRQSFRDKTAAERAVDRTLAALFHGAEDNPLEVQIAVGETARSGGDHYLVPVKLKIPLFKLGLLNRADSLDGSLRLVVVTRDPEGGLSAVRQVPVSIHIPRQEMLTALGQYYLYTLTLKLPPGEQRVAVGIHDQGRGLASYLGHDVRVEAASPAQASAKAADGR
jgi:VWFA-related protein